MPLRLEFWECGKQSTKVYGIVFHDSRFFRQLPKSKSWLVLSAKDCSILIVQQQMCLKIQSPSTLRSHYQCLAGKRANFLQFFFQSKVLMRMETLRLMEANHFPFKSKMTSMSSVQILNFSVVFNQSIS